MNVNAGGSNGSSSPVTNPEVFGLLKSNVQGAQAVANRPFQPFTGQQTAPLSANEGYGAAALPGILSAGAPALGVAGETATGLTNFNPGDLLGGIQKYQNPYQRDVINTTMSDMERSRQMQRVNDSQSATQAGAYGGSRHGVADSLTNESFQRTGASTLANLNQQGFNTAAGLAQSDQNANIQGAGIRQNAAGLMGQLSQQQTGNYKDYITGLLSTGATQRGIDQAGNDAAYQEFLRAQSDPVMMQQLISQAMGLVPGSIGQGSKSSSWNAGFGIA